MISVGMDSFALARDYLAKGEGKHSLFFGCACVSEAQWQAVYPFLSDMKIVKFVRKTIHLTISPTEL
ncbi:hypothetical protein ACFQO1_03360 [Jejudonia soesokkakensis]|uniref:Uncharacterized protein n=1 Tax=Jejudonia soesokkakensis TaxID=1323432 RepID=A0ABW2MRF1_9FLAO